jgi:membrane protein DedA with SNARE-associated domain
VIELLGAVDSLSVTAVFDSAAGWAGRYGYWAIMLVVAGDGVFPVLPGETAIITGAVLAADGRLDVPLVILFGAVGAVIGDSTAYWIGRAGGPQIRRFIGRLAGAERVEAAERMVRRQGPALVLVGRFLPGLRLAVNVSCGAGNMAFPRFLLFDSIGAIVWSTQATLLGYFAGRAFADQLWLALLVALAVAALVGAAIAVRERRRVQRERAAASREPGADSA